jgi:hypothetical protein
MSNKKKDKQAGQLAKAVAAAAKNKGISKEELKFIKNLQTAAKKDGNVTKKELAVIKKEIKKQSTDKNNIVAKSAKSDPGKYLKTKVKSYGAKNSSSSQSSSETNSNMDPTPTPNTTTTPEPVVVKTPTRNITDISSLVPQFNAEHITRIVFENLSAIELSMIERTDTIEGINQKYSIISNLSEIRKKYDATRHLTTMDKASPLTSVFSIDLRTKIPQEDYLNLQGLNSVYQYLDENNKLVDREKGNVYIDSNGDLVIELVNIESDQQVEIEIDTNGTIYKVESYKVES